MDWQDPGEDFPRVAPIPMCWIRAILTACRSRTETYTNICIAVTELEADGLIVSVSTPYDPKMPHAWVLPDGSVFAWEFIAGWVLDPSMRDRDGVWNMGAVYARDRFVEAFERA